MKNNMLVIILILLLSSTSHAAPNNVESTFCAADLKGPRNPSGYNCKPDEKVTTDDFVYSNLTVGDIDKRFKFGYSPVTATVLPGLNGVDLSAAIVGTEKDGLSPFHTHPKGTEMIIMVQGQLDVVFVQGKKVYKKTVQVGDVMVIPQGLLHFQSNSGKGTAINYSVFDSPNPGFQIVSENLFACNLTSQEVSRATGISVDEVKKLQKSFGG